MTFNQAVIAKLTVKKLITLTDQVETLLACTPHEPSIKLAASDWFTEMRVHLRKLEAWSEQSVD
jgi:hypothetical protein